VVTRAKHLRITVTTGSSKLWWMGLVHGYLRLTKQMLASRRSTPHNALNVHGSPEMKRFFYDNYNT